jgi:hypothetical protein
MMANALTRLLGTAERWLRAPFRGRHPGEERGLLRAFRSGRPPEGGFHHVHHLRLARLYLLEAEPDVAVPRYCRDLRRFATALGAPEKYHETITRAFLLLVAERMARSGPGADFDEFAAAHPELLEWEPSILSRYYRPETLGSELARRSFVLPDAGVGGHTLY